MQPFASISINSFFKKIRARGSLLYVIWVQLIIISFLDCCLVSISLWLFSMNGNCFLKKTWTKVLSHYFQQWGGSRELEDGQSQNLDILEEQMSTLGEDGRWIIEICPRPKRGAGRKVGKRKKNGFERWRGGRGARRGRGKEKESKRSIVDYVIHISTFDFPLYC